jgi:hypothetical protein
VSIFPVQRKVVDSDKNEHDCNCRLKSCLVVLCSMGLAVRLCYSRCSRGSYSVHNVSASTTIELFTATPHFRFHEMSLNLVKRACWNMVS